MKYKRIRKVYTSAALLSFNTVVSFLVINLGFYVIFLILVQLTDNRSNPVAEKYGKEKIDKHIKYYTHSRARDFKKGC